MWAIKVLNRHNRKIWPTTLVLIILGPIFYYFEPWLNFSPDILYVKAKVFQILQGGVFTDPITGYNTFHPPFYHLFLAPFTVIGLSLETVLILITISNISLMFFFIFKVVEGSFDSETGFYTCLMIPFIVSCMGRGEILLASSFYFSVPFYLAGLWLYLKPEKSIRLAIVASGLWGIAFLVSPVYVFLLGLTFFYDFLVLNQRRRLLIMVATFLVTIAPFIIQGIYIYSQDLWGSSAFSIWRGFPDMHWWSSLVIRFISPSMGRLEIISSILHAVILITAIFIFIREKKIFWFIPILLLAYLLTFYHFSGQYASRIQIFLSVFVTAGVIHRFAQTLKNKNILVLTLSLVLIFSVIKHYAVAVPTYKIGEENRANLMLGGGKLYKVMDSYLVKNKYIFCTKFTHRWHILGRFPAHSLGAWRTMDYYQLNDRIAEMLETDYQAAFNSTDYELIKGIADKYDIDRALFSGDDENLPLSQTLLKRWQLVYADEYFYILSRPD
jgi:hypothetical protein